MLAIIQTLPIVSPNSFLITTKCETTSRISLFMIKAEWPFRVGVGVRVGE